MARERADGELPGGVERVDVDHLHLLADQTLAGQGQRQGAQRAVEFGVRQESAEGLGEQRIQRQATPRRGVAGQLEQQALSQLLASVPAVEGVAVVRHQERQLAALAGHAQPHGRREAPQQRGYRWRIHPREHEALLVLLQRQHAGGGPQSRLSLQHQRQVRAIRAQQTQRDGYRQRRGGWLTLGARQRLAERQLVTARPGVVRAVRLHAGRSRLRVPALEAPEVQPVGIGHGRAKVVARDRLTVVPLEVQVQTPPEASGPSSVW